MTFNRQVLEQVAKDGTTYKSLAKEMAKALLEGLPSQLPQDGFECYLVMRDEGDPIDPDALDAAENEGLPIVTYRAGCNKSGMRTYFVRIIPREQF